jgi:hypothetical protein
MGGSAAERLRAAVLARRDQLKFSRRQVSLNGGPSEPTLLKIERGQGDDLGAATFRKLDIGLQWEAGSAARVAVGGTPAAAARSDVALASGGLSVPVAAVAEVTKLVGELQDLADVREDESLRSISERLALAIRPIYGSYVTSVLEANRRSSPGGLAAILQLLGPFLDEPIPTDAADVSEWKYRRWLAGQTDGLTKAQEQRFQRRLEQSDE